MSLPGVSFPWGFENRSRWFMRLQAPACNRETRTAITRKVWACGPDVFRENEKRNSHGNTSIWQQDRNVSRSKGRVVVGVQVTKDFERASAFARSGFHRPYLRGL